MPGPQILVSESEDGAWENIYPSGRPVSPPSSDSRRSTSITPRRRKTGRTVHAVPSQRKQFTLLVSSPPKQPRPRPLSSSPPSQISPPTALKLPWLRVTAQGPRTYEPIVSLEELLYGLIQGLAFTARYCLDVLRRAIVLLRYPLSTLVFLWLLALLVTRISNTLRAAFAPLCYVPGISRMALCRPAGTHPVDRGAGAGAGGWTHPPLWADYPRLVDVQNAAFEQLLDQAVGGAGLSLEIKKAEMATADLVTLVRVSNLRSRDVLADSLSDFVEDARRTGRGLQKLSSKIGGAVDGIMAVNDYALHTIEEAISKRSSWNPLVLFLPWRSLSPSTTSQVVTMTFTETMDVLGGEMQRLILEAEVSLANLNTLEERLATLHGIVAREDSSLTEAKAELLAELWTTLGGNKRALRGLDEHLVLLRNLGWYRRRALAHVVAAMQTLQAMSADMEDLRERVAAPELTDGRIPVEVHMKSIRSGLERLREGRVKAKVQEEEAIRRVLVESE